MSAAAVAQPKVLLVLLMLFAIIGGAAWVLTDHSRNPWILQVQRLQNNIYRWDNRGRFPSRELCHAAGHEFHAATLRNFRCQYDPEGHICRLPFRPCGGIF